jgi:hypothetical protein
MRTALELGRQAERAAQTARRANFLEGQVLQIAFAATLLRAGVGGSGLFREGGPGVLARLSCSPGGTFGGYGPADATGSAVATGPVPSCPAEARR